MTLEIRFGTIEEKEEDGCTYQVCSWPDFEAEDDGTNAEYSLSSGMNYRDMSYSSVADWCKASYQIKTLFGVLDGYASDNRSFPLDKTMMKMITKLSTQYRDPLYSDRVIWLKYWANRAVQEFGDKAVISLS